ncbi:hypothetical protein [Microcystis aeruginosa]|uniref:hypothetical protein n=1 Tax=Microcystis aeruginosa TaxID=1126 RepID=UPI001C860BE9|nr:hypothetical protein [Microcystis aeruginosa]
METEREQAKIQLDIARAALSAAKEKRLQEEYQLALEPTFRTLSVTTSRKRKERESKYLSRGVSWRQAAGN